jgi:hypothetical protein
VLCQNYWLLAEKNQLLDGSSVLNSAFIGGHNQGQVLCRNAAKLSVLKNHSCAAVRQPSLQGRFALNQKASRLAGIRFEELFDALRISTLPFIYSKPPLRYRLS